MKVLWSVWGQFIATSVWRFGVNSRLHCIKQIKQTNQCHIYLEYETDETNIRNAYHDFVQNYDVDEGAELASIRPVKVESQKPKANQAEMKASTNVNMPFHPALDDHSTNSFREAEAEICAGVKNGGNIESCKVDSFSKNQSKTVADLSLKYKTDEVRQSRISDDFKENYEFGLKG